MKKITLLSIIIFYSVASYCQAQKDTAISKSKLEEFSQKSGIMFKKDFYKLGDIRNLTFQILTITDLNSNDVISGLRLQGVSSNGTFSTTSVAFLDRDEIDGFLNAVNYMINNVINTPPPLDDLEYTYKSKSGFSITAFNGLTGGFSNKVKWQTNFQLEPYLASSSIYESADDLSKVRDLIMAAKSKLSQ